MDEHTFTLPWPPSMNRYWRSVSGRVLISAEGRKYRDAVAVAALGGHRFGRSPIAVQIDAWLPDLRRRDVDNLLKAPLDALTRCGVWNDDEQVQELGIRKAGVDRVNPRLAVRVWTVPALECSVSSVVL